MFLIASFFAPLYNNFDFFPKQYGSDEFPHDSPVGSTRYASPKAGGALYQPEQYFDSASGTWYFIISIYYFLCDYGIFDVIFVVSDNRYSSPSNAYAPQSSATSYHHIGHSPHLGPPHGHDHYSLSPVTHDGHIQVNETISFSHSLPNGRQSRAFKLIAIQLLLDSYLSEAGQWGKHF